MYLSFMLGNGNLVACTEKYLTLDTEIKSNWLIFADSAQAFIAGLAAYRVFRSTRNTLWADRGKKLKESMSHWAEEGTAWNFEHKLRLMEAEECYSLGDVGTAQKCYGMAIEGAKRHRFVNDLALCYEIAAMFYFGIGEVQKSLEHFRLAHEAYTSWGANGKATQLFVFITETFEPLCE
jgi:tetratricopeptide (TPR) repeat protein